MEIIDVPVGREVAGRVVVDLVRYEGAYDVSALAGHGPLTLDRRTIDPAAGTVTQRRLDDRPQEFPRVDDRAISQPHRYGYSAVIGAVGQATVSPSGDFADDAFANALLKHDLAAGTVQAHQFGGNAPPARPSSPRPHPTPPRTTATSWPSSTIPTVVPPTWSSSPHKISPGSQSPASTSPPGSRSAFTAAGFPTSDCPRHIPVTKTG